MAKGKSKPDTKITQLELFREEQPAETGEAEAQAEIRHSEQAEEIIPPKKRGRNKKIKAEEIQADVPAPDQSGNMVAESVSIAVEETAIPPKPADDEQTEVKEARLKEKYKKIQEERLAALKKARGVK